jgi:hypothetical protein
MIFTNQSVKKKVALISMLLLTTGFLSSCAAGKNAPTRLIKQVTDGVEGQSGEIKLRNILVVARDTSTAVLVGTIVNQGDQADSLTAITVGDDAALVQRVDYLLAKNAPITFEGPIANARLVLTPFPVIAGHHIKVKFGFVKAAPVELSALIVNGDGIYQDAGVTPLAVNLNRAP